MPPRPFLPLALVALAACSSPEEVAEKAGVTPAAQASASAEASSARGNSVSEETDLYHFDYAYPGAAAAIPALRDALEAELAEQKAALVKEAQVARTDAQDGGYPFNPHSFAQEWEALADLPGYLSLAGEFATYSGGAHGMYGMESLVWDKARGRRLAGIDLFVSPGALNAALDDRLCESLNAERAERRGQPVPEDSEEMFDQCVGVEEATVLLHSGNGRAFDRLTVWIGPYVAGPYAEGSFALDFPVDAAVRGAVKPVHRSAFARAE